MVDPATMCRKHLLGEHVEIHMFVGSIIKGISMTGYIENGLMEPAALYKRHEDLVAEMVDRGYNHRSTFQAHTVELKKLMEARGEDYNARVDRNLAKTELYRRCADCEALGRKR